MSSSALAPRVHLSTLRCKCSLSLKSVLCSVPDYLFAFDNRVHSKHRTGRTFSVLFLCQAVRVLLMYFCTFRYACSPSLTCAFCSVPDYLFTLDNRRIQSTEQAGYYPAFFYVKFRALSLFINTLNYLSFIKITY